jgi:hypothetical protein
LRKGSVLRPPRYRVKDLEGGTCRQLSLVRFRDYPEASSA